LTWKNDVNDSHLKLYIDGVLDTLRYDSGAIQGTTAGVQKLMLGCGTKGRYWNGLIDDVRIYNRSLSDSEINTVKAGGSVAGLIAHWKFDETYPDVAVTAEPPKQLL